MPQIAIEIEGEAMEYIQEEIKRRKLNAPAIFIWPFERTACCGGRGLCYVLASICDENSISTHGTKVGSVNQLSVYVDNAMEIECKKIIIGLTKLFLQPQLVVTII